MDYEAKKVFLVNMGVAIVTCGLVYLIFRFMLAYLLPFVVGIILAFLMQKPAAVLAPKLKLKTGTCAALLVALTYAVLIALMVFAIVRISVMAGGFLNDLPSHLMRLTKYITRVYGNISHRLDDLPDGTFKTIDEMARTALGNLTVGVTGFFSNFAASFAKATPQFLISAIVTVVASCYFAKDFTLIVRFFRNFLKQKTYNTIVRIKNILTDSLLKFLLGYLILMGITYVELLCGFLVLRIKYAPLIALIVALIDVLPVLGTGTVLIPWAVFAVASGNTAFGIGLGVLYGFMAIIRNFLEPRIIGKQIGINPMLSLLTMFIGLKLFGMVGMILMPISFIVLITFYKQEMNSEKTI